MVLPIKFYPAVTNTDLQKSLHIVSYNHYIIHIRTKNRSCVGVAGPGHSFTWPSLLRLGYKKVPDYSKKSLKTFGVLGNFSVIL